MRIPFWPAVSVGGVFCDMIGGAVTSLAWKQVDAQHPSIPHHANARSILMDHRKSADEVFRRLSAVPHQRLPAAQIKANRSLRARQRPDGR
jgi:hypothetical protein